MNHDEPILTKHREFGLSRAATALASKPLVAGAMAGTRHGVVLPSEGDGFCECDDVEPASLQSCKVWECLGMFGQLVRVMLCFASLPSSWFSG